MMQLTFRLGPRALQNLRRTLLLAALAGAAMGAPLRDAAAQAPPFPPGGGQQGANPICQRLETQLAAIDRGQSGDPRADQIRRLEETAARQQDELDRVVQQAKRLGCESSGLFAIFGGQSAQCGPVNRQIQQMRGALDQTMTSLDRLRGPGGSDRDGQRRSVLMALAQNNCGPQYAAAARTTPSGGFLNDLFGGGATPDGPPSSTFRTVCVRSCDGFFFPISFATVPSRFADDERACKKLCPAAEALLYTYRNPGEDMSSAVSISGQPYSQLPNAFRYRQEFNPACGCKAPGQSWADALKNTDDRSTVEQGDILVTEERAKQLAQPRDAQGRPVRPPPQNNAAAQPTNAQPTNAQPTSAAPQAPPAAPPASNGDQPAKPIRSVGPTYIPAR